MCRAKVRGKAIINAALTCDCKQTIAVAAELDWLKHPLMLQLLLFHSWATRWRCFGALWAAELLQAWTSLLQLIYPLIQKTLTKFKPLADSNKNLLLRGNF